MDVRVISVPYDTGRRDLRMGLGPQALLDAGLLDELHEGGHTAELRITSVPDGPLVPEPQVALGMWREVAGAVSAAREVGAFPVVLTGSCYAAVGMAAGLGPKDLGVCWFDAHADCNTPGTTVTGFLDGMAVAILTGRCWEQLTGAVPGFRPIPDERIVLIGVRDVDPLERELMAGTRLTTIAPGADHEIPLALGRLRNDSRGTYLHVDLDVLDPSVGVVNHLSRGPGLSLEEILSDIGTITRTVPVQGLTLSAYAPEFDREGRVPKAALAILRAVLGAPAAA